MKTWKCPNCKRERETEDDIKMLVCRCQEEMEEVKWKS